MSKPVKQMISKELTERFAEVDSVAICGFTGLDSEATYAMRGKLAEKDIKITVVKNSLARSAFKTAGLDDAIELLDGPCAVAYGADSIVTVVRELLDVHKEAPALTVKGAVLDGEVFSGDAEVMALSKFPTRDEALGQVVGCVLSAGANLAGCLVGPAGQIAGILKAIEEKAGDSEAA
ncbi:MAG: 50S ribosomal protein L10 [Phycisphaerae bacterium]|nr:50S ribosomal protein L10 [Phycisphaerae bacterium]